VGRRQPGDRRRTPEAWIEKNFPSILVQAEKPRPDVELQAAQAACGSLAMQKKLIEAVGIAHANSLMALYGGKVGSITVPMPVKDDTKPGKRDKKSGGDNPWMLGPDEGHAERVRIISTLGTKVA
jgi:hypothetical protein